MQVKSLIILFLCCIMGMQQSASAQCGWDNSLYANTTAPTTPNTDVLLSGCFYGGEYAYVTGLVAGSTYRFFTCGDTDFDTQITVYEAGPGSVLAYNDDFCGVQSQVEFVYPGGSGAIDVLIDQFNCASNSTCMTLYARLVGPPPPAGGCGVSGSYCYIDNDPGTEFASTTPSGSQVASITLSGSVEPCCDQVFVRENGVNIAGPFAGALSGTYTGAVGATLSLYLTSDHSNSCASGYSVGFSIACTTPVAPPPAGGCGVSGNYCYGDSNPGTEFASTTPAAGQAVSITLSGSMEPCCDAVYVRENGVNVAGPFTGVLSGTYTGAVGATLSLYLTSDGSASCTSGLSVGFSIACATPGLPNEECAGAIALSVGSGSCGSSIAYNNATATSSVPAFGCGGGAKDLWYSIVVPDLTCQNLVINSTADFDGVLDVVNTCGGIEVFCNDDYTATYISQITITQAMATAAGITTGSTIYARIAGYYSNTITGNICAYTAPVTLTYTGSASCGGGLNTGIISQDATGGSGSGYTYAITGGSFGPALANGTYTITVTDGNGCEGTGTATVSCSATPTLSITDPCNCTAGINLDADPENELAQEVITIAPGTAPYTVTAVTGLVNATGTALTTTDATALITGPDALGNYTITAYVPADGVITYSLTVQDANGLSATINGGPCNACPVACAASTNMQWGN